MKAKAWKRTLLASCLTASMAAYAGPLAVPPAKITLEGTEVVVRGVLLPGVDDEFRKLVRDAESVTGVRIRSEGGATVTALEMAEEIERRALQVVVDGYCLSSCANYIYVAGRSRKVLPDSVLGFHGGHTDSPWEVCDESSCRLSIRSRELLEREQKLFLRKRVSLDAIVISSWIVRRAPMRRAGVPVPHDQSFSFWVPSAAAMAAMGFSTSDDYWAPASDSEGEAVMVRHGYRAVKPFVGDAPTFTQPDR